MANEILKELLEIEREQEKTLRRLQNLINAPEYSSLDEKNKSKVLGEITNAEGTRQRIKKLRYSLGIKKVSNPPVGKKLRLGGLKERGITEIKVVKKTTPISAEPERMPTPLDGLLKNNGVATSVYNVCKEQPEGTSYWLDYISRAEALSPGVVSDIWFQFYFASGAGYEEDGLGNYDTKIEEGRDCLIMFKDYVDSSERLAVEDANVNQGN